MKKPLYKPTKKEIVSSNMYKFMKFAEKYSGRKFKDYNALYEWSVTEIEKFWETVWDYSGLIYRKKYKSVLNKRIMPGAKWFQASRLNFAENLLKFKDDRIALISVKEKQKTQKITYLELYNTVSACAENLRRLGLKKGDRVAAYINNIPEAVVAMLAVTSIGAIWSSCSTDFGIKGVLDRFTQIEPKFLFATEEYSYNGKFINVSAKIKKIAGKINSIRKIVLIPHTNNIKNTTDVKPYKKNAKYLYFNQLLLSNKGEITFEHLPFDHPVYILYSSGTTGVPKCIVHGAGGTLLQHYKELALHTDLKREDTIMYFTTCGWMMWNWLISSLQIGASILLYDGSPVYPNKSALWKLIETEKITIFGTSPKFLSLCQSAKLIPKEKYDLSSLRVILSTGSPLTDENFNWVYNSVKSKIRLSSISGGTDIVSCFMLGNPMLPVYSSEIQCRGLGMSVKAFDEKGNEVYDEKGELVCTKPFPSMPVYFWNDKSDKKYKSAYFDYYKNVWRHGDFIKITPTGGIVVFGRSDATLNPGGVRIGTAEIYNVVESISEISDSIVVGKKWKDDIKVVLFVVLNKNKTLTEALKTKIKTKIKTLASPRHVPAFIYQVKEIPRTLSGKKVEIAVSKIINCETVNNTDSIANPESLDEFKNFQSIID